MKLLIIPVVRLLRLARLLATLALITPGSGLLVLSACSSLGVDSPSIADNGDVGTNEVSPSGSLPSPEVVYGCDDVVTGLTSAESRGWPMPRWASEEEVIPSSPVDLIVEHGAPVTEDLEVLDAAVATGVEGREPLWPKMSFRPGETVWAWVKLKNPADRQDITMHWLRDGRRTGTMRLAVGQSPRWRTWSRRTLRHGDEGLWRVEVRDAMGTILHTLSFDVTDEEPDLDPVGC